MAPRMHVIADDLTGAADTGAAFAAAGLRTRLLLLDDENTHIDQDADVVVFDTGSRDLAREDAAANARMIARRLPRDASVFKKVDSLLRGHPAAETALLREQLQPELVVVAPAFPALGRTTVDSVVHVHGAALHDSELWAHERSAVPRSVLDVLPGQPVLIEQVRGPAAELPTLLSQVHARGGIGVFDAKSDDDLDRIVAAARAASDQILWVGAGGLGAALARSLATGPASPPPHPRGGYLAVVGSADPMARQQAEALGGLGAAVLEVDAVRLSDAAYVVGIAAEVTRAAACGDLVVHLSPPAGPPRGRAETATALADLVTVAARDAGILVLVGGATAHAVLRARGVRVLTLAGEVEPGVVIGVPDDAPDSTILTKAGSFGDVGTLARVLAGVATSDPVTARVPSGKATT